MASYSHRSLRLETVFEEDVLTREQLQAKFSEDALHRLIEYGALRPQSVSSCRVTFVGLAVADGQTYQFVPKIFKASGPLDDNVMRQVVRALRRYASWKPDYHEDAPFLKANTATPVLSAIAIADWIIRDYLTFGIYRRTVERGQIDGMGQASWGQTIERLDPIFVRGRPNYLSLVTRSATGDSAHFVSRLHRHLVERAFSHFGHLLGYPTISLDHEPFAPFPEFPPIPLCQTNLRRELRQVFTDRAMHLLPVLLAYLSAAEMWSRQDLTLYGMTSFYLLWEEACASALGNERAGWQTHIPRPTWTGHTGISQQAETFRPDIVTSLGDGSARCLLIADAKYYRLTMPPGLDGQPGVNDVAKQVWYEQCLTEPARTRGFNYILNIFVLPGLDGSGSFFPDGKVEFSAVGNAYIGVTRLASLEALERYTERRSLDRSLVRSVSAVATGIQA